MFFIKVGPIATMLLISENKHNSLEPYDNMFKVVKLRVRKNREKIVHNFCFLKTNVNVIFSCTSQFLCKRFCVKIFSMDLYLYSIWFTLGNTLSNLMSTRNLFYKRSESGVTLRFTKVDFSFSITAEHQRSHAQQMIYQEDELMATRIRFVSHGMLVVVPNM